MYLKSLLRQAVLFTGIFILFSGCENKCENTTTYATYEPIYMSWADFKSAVKSLDPQALQAPGKIFIYGKYLFVNELNKGIHIIDNSNPSSPQNISFINIPGNVDLAVNGSYLYADSYSDLIVIDISNPLNCIETKRIDNAFYNSYHYGITSQFIQTGIIDSVRGVIVDWKQKSVTTNADCNPMAISCPNCQWVTYDNAALSSTSSNTSVKAAGKGGSLARFAIADEKLYTVDRSYLYKFDIANSSITASFKTSIGWNIETIFPYKDYLFIGSTTGMFIYEANDSGLKQVSTFSHTRACDPVVVDDKYAYVTLRSNNNSLCGPAQSNQLDVIDISDITNPHLYKTFGMNSPYGLGIDGDNLFICEGSFGLDRFDKKDISNVDKNLKETIGNVTAYDVIPYNNLLIMTAQDGIYQYDYSNPDKLTLLSKILISNP